MPAYKQQSLPLQIATPFGKDVLLITGFNGSEQLGRLFQYELVLQSEQEDLDHNKILGQGVTIRLDRGKQEPRFFHGCISRFARAKHGSRMAEYRATMVPWFWFLTRASDCRIFQNLAIPQIVKQVFQELGFSEVSERLFEAYEPWDYCVQYRETAFDFVSRLLEEEGIYYFFQHEHDKHLLVLCDSSSAHRKSNGPGELVFWPNATVGVEALDAWAAQHEVQSGAYATTDFDFTTPHRDTQTNSQHHRGHGQSAHEQFDYLGERSPFRTGERYSKLRLEEQQAGHETYSGEGDDRNICAGTRFVLKGHPGKDVGKEFLTTGVEYQIQQDLSAGPEAPAKGFKFRARLTAIPAAGSFRSPRRTPKPVVPGPQTAIVVGPAGEKIHTDQYGRVKVQFHWDRRGQKDENSSCWLRVSQAWAGKLWGDMAIPHVGDEVIVECLEGDPDRPIITGRVFNQNTMPPFHLPAHKHKRVWTDDYGNRLVFDGSPGDEHIRMHSPHHKSMLSLGRSNTMFSVENFIQGNLGLNIQCVVGAAIQNYFGGYLQSIEGTNISWTIGDFWQAVLGPSSQVFLGPQFNYNKGYQYQQYDGDLMKVSQQNVVISSGTIANLVGGASSAAGTTNLYSDGTVLELSAGPTLAVGSPADPSVPPLVWELIALPAVAALLAGLTAAGNGLVDSSDNSLSGAAKDWQDGLVGGAIGAEAVSIVMTICTLSQLSVEAFQAKPVKHLPGQAKAQLKLCTDGTAYLSGQKMVYAEGPQKSGALYLDNGRSELWHQTQASICSGPPGPVSPNYVVAEAAGQVRIGAQTMVTMAAPTIDIGSGALTIMAGTPGPMQMIKALEANLAALANEATNTANYVKEVAAQEVRLAADVAKLLKLPK